MPDDVVFTVAIERTGVIWMGTESHGVVRFDENQWVGLPAMVEFNRIAICPNPCRTTVNVIPNGKDIYSIRVLDITGETKLVQKYLTPVSSFTTVDLSLLPAGIYFLKADLGEKSVTRKIVKVE